MLTVIIILSHGSVQSGAGEYLQKHTELLQARFPNEQLEFAFLNYGSPSLPEKTAELIKAGVAKFIIVPYFLVEGKFFLEDIQELLNSLRDKYPTVNFSIELPLGEHPSLESAVHDAINSVSLSAETKKHSGLILLLHGSPHAESNRPAYQIVENLRISNKWKFVTPAHIDCNEPDIQGAVTMCVNGGVDNIVVVPWFLHKGKHVVKDIPNELAVCQKKFPQVSLIVTDPVGKFESVNLALKDRVESGLISAEKKEQ